MFGRGKIDISIQKTSYAPGDTISGSVNLILKEPVKAREMTISLVGEYRTRVTTHGWVRRVNTTTSVKGILRGGRTIAISDDVARSMPKQDLNTSIETVRIYGFEEQLDGEIEYSQSQRYHFKGKIPVDTSTSSIIKWYLLVKLDIPHGRDVIKKVRITIG